MTFECNVCKHTFRKIDDIIHHSKFAHDDTGLERESQNLQKKESNVVNATKKSKTIICKYCKVDFKSRKSLNKHVVEVHADIKEKVKDSTKSNMTKESLKKVQKKKIVKVKSTCEVCGFFWCIPEKTQTWCMHLSRWKCKNILHAEHTGYT